jgi:hypothetical protein
MIGGRDMMPHISLDPAFFWGNSMFEKPGVSQIVLGLFVLCLAMIMWEITGNSWAYKVLYIPAGVMIFYGVYIAWRDG